MLLPAPRKEAKRTPMRPIHQHVIFGMFGFCRYIGSVPNTVESRSTSRDFRDAVCTDRPDRGLVQCGQQSHWRMAIRGEPSCPAGTPDFEVTQISNCTQFRETTRPEWWFDGRREGLIIWLLCTAGTRIWLAGIEVFINTSSRSAGRSDSFGGAPKTYATIEWETTNECAQIVNAAAALLLHDDSKRVNWLPGGALHLILRPLSAMRNSPREGKTMFGNIGTRYKRETVAEMKACLWQSTWKWW